MEDNAILNEDIPIDIIYRKISDFDLTLDHVVNRHNSYNGFTTCMWHNLRTCRVIYDKDGRLGQAKKRFEVPYPKELRDNIIERNRKLLHTAMPAYEAQIAKAVKRGDVVSISHRTAAFMESYFDIIFALNECTHPGEKRLISLCKTQCRRLPEHFEENLNQLFRDLYVKSEAVAGDLSAIIRELEKIL